MQVAIVLFVWALSSGLSALLMVQVGYFSESFAGREGDNGLPMMLFFAGLVVGIVMTVPVSNVVPIWLVPIATPIATAIAIGLLIALGYGISFVCLNASRFSRTLGRKARELRNEYRFHRDMED